AQEVVTGQRERAAAAQQALDYLKGKQAGSLSVLGVDKTLIQCAEDASPFVREITAFALNFWEGTAAENDRLEQVLVKLANDDGRGEEQLAQLRDTPEEATDEALTRVPGLKVRYNATIALARRGSARVRLGMLGEML